MTDPKTLTELLCFRDGLETYTLQHVNRPARTKVHSRSLQISKVLRQGRNPAPCSGEGSLDRDGHVHIRQSVRVDHKTPQPPASAHTGRGRTSIHGLYRCVARAAWTVVWQLGLSSSGNAAAEPHGRCQQTRHRLHMVGPRSNCALAGAEPQMSAWLAKDRANPFHPFMIL